MIFKIYRDSWESKKDYVNPLRNTSFEKMCRECVDSAEEELDGTVYEWFINIDSLEDLLKMQQELKRPVTIKKDGWLKIQDVTHIVW